MTGARISPHTPHPLFIIVTNVKGNLFLIWLNLTFIITLGAKNWLGKSKFLLGWLPMVFIGVNL